MAVIVAEQISYPGDTVKRKMFMQACTQDRKYKSAIDCFFKVYREQGIAAFWKGAFSNILRGVGSSLCLILYDEIKILAGRKH